MALFCVLSCSIQALFRQPPFLVGQKVGRERGEEAIHQRLDALARRAVHGGELEAARLAEIALALRARHDLAERAIGDESGTPTWLGEAVHDLSGKVLRRAEQPEPLVRAVAYRGGMGAGEERRH